MGFKEDQDFVRFLTMGAYGTAAVKDDLNRRGHQIIELERYAMANKVWAVKVKRLRLPDLLCVRCGRRFESKAKARLEITLSHSATSGREWYAGGMRRNDAFAFLRVVLRDDLPALVGPPAYFTPESLHAGIGLAREGARKARSEGSETTVTWPGWVPKYGGHLVSVDHSNGDVIVRCLDSTIRVYRHGRSWPTVNVYLRPDEAFQADATVVAGPVARADVWCTGEEWDWLADLSSSDRVDRYAAIKAIPFRQAPYSEPLLAPIAHDEAEDWRVRLEAIGGLAASVPSVWLDRLGAVAADTTQPQEQQMEAILLLSEIKATHAAAHLHRIARNEANRHPEIRAAAVWALGLGAAGNADLVAEFVADDDDRVALHAAAALPANVPPSVQNRLVEWLHSGDDREAAVAATLLSRCGAVDHLVTAAKNGVTDGALFALRALGDMPRDQVKKAIAEDRRLIDALEPMWIQQRDWLRKPDNIGALDILDSQRMRF